MLSSHSSRRVDFVTILLEVFSLLVVDSLQDVLTLVAYAEVPAPGQWDGVCRIVQLHGLQDPNYHAQLAIPEIPECITA